MHHRRASVGNLAVAFLNRASCFRADCCRERVFLSRVQPILYVILNPYLRLKYDAISTEMITVSIVKSF